MAVILELLRILPKLHKKLNSLSKSNIVLQYEHKGLWPIPDQANQSRLDMAQSDLKITKLPRLIGLGPVPDYWLIWAGPMIWGTGPTNLGPVMLDRVQVSK